MARAWPPTCCGVASVAPASALMYLMTVHHHAALLLLVGHVFPDSEALLATRGAHLPEAETLYVGRWKVGVHLHWLEGTLGAEVARLGQVEEGGGRERVLLTRSRRHLSVSVPLRLLEPYLSLQRFFYLKDPPVTAIGV